MSPLLKHIGAAGVMVLGSALVLGLMAWMNSYTQPPEKQARQAGTVIDLAPKKPKQKKIKPKPRRQKPKPSRSARPRTPPPNLSSSLSGVALGGAMGLSTDLGAAGDQLVGADPGESLVMTSDSVDEPPKATRRVPPQYPAAARKRGITGFVKFKLTIGADGQVQRARIVAAEPPGVFEEAAQMAIDRWAFSPGRYQGQAQTVTGVEQTIRFQLSRGG